MSVYNHNGKDVFYEVAGDLSSNKKAIIILNGIMMNVRSWDAFVSPFTKENVLVRFDMFDQGLSAKMEQGYTQDVQVSLLKGLLDELGISKVSIVGISYGASVGLQFAVKHQEYLDKLVIANGVAKTSDWLKAIGDGWNQVGKTRDGLAYYNISIPYIYSPMFYQNNIKWMEDRKKLLVPIFSYDVFLDAMERLTLSSHTHDVIDKLASIRVKTLIIAASEDYLTPVFEQQLIQKHIPNSELVIIPECGHASMYEKPELFTSLSLGFINSDQEKIIN